MALSGSVAFKATTENNLIFSWAAVQSPAENCSYINWQLLLEAKYFGRIDAGPGSPWTVTIAGQEFTGTTSLAIGNNETKVLASGVARVAHAADGTGSFDFSFDQVFWINWSGNLIERVTGSGSAVLDTIARASQPRLGAASVELGGSLEIFTDRAPDFTHTLQYSFGNASGVIAQGVGDSCRWTPPLELASQIPNAVSGTAVITCTTYAGDAHIGTKEVTVTLTVPALAVPIASATWEDISGAYGALGAYVKNITRLAVTVSGTGSYSSTVTGASVTLGGRPYSGGIITDSGELSLMVSVTDSRGRTGTAAYSITVADYSPPRLSLSASRCTADGTADDTGDHAVITVSGFVTEINESNAASVTLVYGGESVTQDFPSGEVLFQKTVYADPDATMTITAALSDKLVSSSRTMVLSTGYATLDLLAGGKGISFGKAATMEGFDCAMDAYFRNGLYEIHSDGTVDSRSLFDRVAALEALLP